MKGDIKRIGNLSLGYKTFIGREAKAKDLEICAWNKDNTKYTIASFEYDEDENYYYLESCGERLNDKRINWVTFGTLVEYAYKILNDEILLSEEQIEIEKWSETVIDELKTKTDYRIQDLKIYIRVLMETQNEIIDEIRRLKKVS